MLKCFGPIRRVCGHSEVSLTVESGARVEDVIMRLIDQFGTELSLLLMDEGRISGNFIIMLNKRDVNTIEGIDTPVKDGDEIAILPHVQGGRW